jgi:hypothetical protein
MNRNDPEVLRLAVEAACDPRSALSALEGRLPRGMVGGRIEAAAKRLKIKLPKEKAR